MKYAWATSRRSVGSFGFQGMLLDTEEASKLCAAPNWLPVSSAFSTAAKTQSWPKSFRLWNSDSESCAWSQMFLHLFRSLETLTKATLIAIPHPYPPCADSKMHSCPKLMNGPLRKTNIHNLCCHLLLLWWKLSQQTSQPLTTKNKVSCSFSQRGVWLQKKQPALQCETVQHVTRLQPLPCF